ncbi:MAG: secretin N-terminal domain-containing protein, partial [Gammaproteobacteria bacterium]
MGPDMGEKLPLDAADVLEDDSSEVVFKQLENEAPESLSTQMKPELFPGTGSFVSSSPYQRAYRSGGGNGKYTLNFDGADLGEVTKVILSDTLGENYVLNPKVTGTVTLQTTRPLTKEELLPTLEMLLKMNNAALVKEDAVYHIEPLAEAMKGSSLVLGKTDAALPVGYQVRIVPLEYVGVQDMMEVLTPLLTEKSIVRVDESRNLLLIAGTGNELEQALDVVSTFDVDVMQGMSFGLFPLSHVDSETIIQELEAILADKEKSPMTGMYRFLSIERLNSVLVITPQVKYLNRIQAWIDRLDRANISAGGGVIVYRVQNVDAEELAETLNSIFTSSAKKQKEPSVAPGLKMAEISNKEAKSVAAKSERSEISLPSGEKVNVKTDIKELADVNVIADKSNNSLVIVATPQQYAMIRPVIQQLDVMPLQVLIDAMIVEVTLTDELKYGVEWLFKSGNL